MFLEELNMSQPRELFRGLCRKCPATTAPLWDGPDRGEPVGAGWLMNTIDFVAGERGLEGDYAHEVKKRARSCCFPVRSEEKARSGAGAAQAEVRGQI